MAGGEGFIARLLEVGRYRAAPVDDGAEDVSKEGFGAWEGHG
jgi:hypothetical protein